MKRKKKRVKTGNYCIHGFHPGLCSSCALPTIDKLRAEVLALRKRNKATATVVRAAVYFVKHLNDHDEHIEPEVVSRICRAVKKYLKTKDK